MKWRTQVICSAHVYFLDKTGAKLKKFTLTDLVYNRNTKEDGTIRRIYETNGVAMYEVAVPQNRDSWTGGYYISDWAEDVLQLSTNEPLKSSRAIHAYKAY
jgi:hypothetical protein